MISNKQRRNAERIDSLARTFGDLAFNSNGQTANKVLNLSIPCASLVLADIVTGVRDTYDGINDGAVADVERTCRAAVEFTTLHHGEGWWTQSANDLNLYSFAKETA